MSKYKKCTKGEFFNYISEYEKQNGVKLVRDVYMACEPPMITYNDFSNGKKWPESIVVKSVADGYMGDPQEYYIPE